MTLADKEDKYYNDALNAYDKLWSKYEREPPVDTQVSQALRLAQNQISSITTYMKEQKIQRSTTGGE